MQREASAPSRQGQAHEISTEAYFRLRRLRLSAGPPEWSLPNRFAFAATRRRYRRTISSPEAPAIRLVPALKASSIFSLTISRASRWAPLPPSISFIIRSPTTRFASIANIIKGWNIRRSSPNCRVPRWFPRAWIAFNFSLAIVARPGRFSRRRLFGLWHTCLAAMLVALIPRAFHIVCLGHGQPSVGERPSSVSV